MRPETINDIHRNVQSYYGETLSGSSDLKTNACCTVTEVPDHVRTALGRVHEEVSSHYYGCGLVAPDHLSGMKVLDLGCGTGRDVYVLAQLVGPLGHVTGVDMTERQLDIARRHAGWHAERFGYEASNVTFLDGLIERLDQLGLEDDSFDVVVSNCVLNLSPEKERVLREVFRVLKPGGEFYFSDVYADRRLPEALAGNEVLYGECLGGALYVGDFRRIAAHCGFPDVRAVSSSPIAVQSAEVAALLGNTRFDSVTNRLFRVPGLEDACEDFGQAVIYRGTIPHRGHVFDLDDHHRFEAGRSVRVCGNTYLMLHESRFRDHFRFFGDMSRHFGLFPDCGEPVVTGTAAAGCC
ncbi:MAG: methyltransferase domain-containing protein [Pseudomonadota bacterium]|nr:methyltransferase domain-containing protein [Pseudomonadota bacterium]